LLLVIIQGGEGVRGGEVMGGNNVEVMEKRREDSTPNW